MISKICGIKTNYALQSCAMVGVDWFGVVYHEKSPRHVAPFYAKKLVHHAHRHYTMQAVLLMVNQDISKAIELIEYIQPDMVQLHGNETPEYCLALRQARPIKIIKAIGVAQHNDILLCNDYENSVDYFLFDTKPQAGDNRPGGLGRSFNWQMARLYQGQKPYLIAGGLNAENIGEAIAQSMPAGVDCSSGVEISPGVKSRQKIQYFMHKLGSLS